MTVVDTHNNAGGDSAELGQYITESETPLLMSHCVFHADTSYIPVRNFFFREEGRIGFSNFCLPIKQISSFRSLAFDLQTAA